MIQARRKPLTPEQSGAVASRSKLRVIHAGAGTGKTTTLVEVIADLVEGRGRESECITAISFTRNAAAELEERVEARLARRHSILFGTSHSLALKILRSGARRLGYSCEPIIYDEQDTADVLRAVAHEHKLTQRDVTAAIEAARAGTPVTSELVAAAAADYENRLLHAGAIDYDLILLLALRVLREHADLKSRWEWRCRYLIVDEYQDTAPEERALYDALAPREMVVVGDPQQSIFGFRGTSSLGLLDLAAKEWADVHYLMQSFRSGTHIIGAANRLIALAPDAPEKMLRPNEGVVDKVEVIHAMDDWANNVRARFNAGQTVAVLARTNDLAATAKLALGESVPVASLATDRPFYALEEVRIFHAALRATIGAADKVTVNLVRKGFFALMPDRTWREADVASIRNDRTILEVLEWGCLGLSEDLVERATEIAEKLAKKYEDGSLVTRASSVREALRRVTLAAADHPKLSIPAFCDMVAMREVIARRKEDATPRAAIDYGTIHAAKGLEWDAVYLFGFDEGVIPSRQSKTEEDVHEERRLAYVAITRARKYLGIVTGVGGAQASPYIEQMLEDPASARRAPLEVEAPW